MALVVMPVLFVAFALLVAADAHPEEKVQQQHREPAAGPIANPSVPKPPGEITRATTPAKIIRPPIQ
jgi:hypothetical protein